MRTERHGRRRTAQPSSLTPRFVVAPNAFKGSLTAEEAAGAIARGMRAALPTAHNTEIPLADGGDGTAAVLLRALGGELVSVCAQDPLGRPIQARYALVENGAAAVVEMAAASGLVLLTHEERNPLVTSTYGTGQLIADAIRRGVRKLIVGIGGSATNDGGAGALQALGARFLDSDGSELGPGGAELARLARIDTRGLVLHAGEAEIVVACDVANPLTGSEGGSAVYGPQKGAALADVQILDSALHNYAHVIREQLGLDVEHIPGTGAAGGLGAGLAALLGAEIRPGIEVVMKAVRFDEALAYAHAVVTGEGKLDAQTGYGKVVSGVVRHASERGIPVVAMVGRVDASPQQVAAMGLAQAIPISPPDMPLEQAMSQAGELLEAAARRWAESLGR